MRIKKFVFILISITAVFIAERADAQFNILDKNNATIRKYSDTILVPLKSSLTIETSAGTKEQKRIRRYERHFSETTTVILFHQFA